MFSFITSIVTTFVFNPMFLIGYAVCVLFPIPFLNSFIISLWSKFGSGIITAVKGLVAKQTAAVETGVTSAVSTAILSTGLTPATTVALTAANIVK